MAFPQRNPLETTTSKREELKLKADVFNAARGTRLVNDLARDMERAASEGHYRLLYRVTRDEWRPQFKELLAGLAEELGLNFSIDIGHYVEVEFSWN